MAFHGPTFGEINKREKLIKDPRDEADGRTDEVGYTAYQVSLKVNRSKSAMLDFYANSAENSIRNLTRFNQDVQKILSEQAKTTIKITLEKQALNILEKVGLSLCDDIAYLQDINDVDFLLQKIEWFLGLLENYGLSDIFSSSFEEVWKKLQEYKSTPRSLQ